MTQPLGASILDVVTAKALGDDQYRQALIANPSQVLGSEGLTIPANVKVVIVENTADTIYLVLPVQARKTIDLSDVDVTNVHAWGGGWV